MSRDRRSWVTLIIDSISATTLPRSTESVFLKIERGLASTTDSLNRRTIAAASDAGRERVCESMAMMLHSKERDYELFSVENKVAVAVYRWSSAIRQTESAVDRLKN